MILYIENPKDTTRKLLELTNDYSKVAGYKSNTQKSVAFLYTNNEKTERGKKKMLNVTHYQRNANQNHNEVPTHASQNGCCQKVYKQ